MYRTAMCDITSYYIVGDKILDIVWQQKELCIIFPNRLPSVSWTLVLELSNLKYSFMAIVNFCV